MQQGFFYIVCINDLCGNVVDRGIEEVKVDMYLVKQIVMYNFIGNCLGFIIQQYYVIVVLVNWMVDVQQ